MHARIIAEIGMRNAPIWTFAYPPAMHFDLVDRVLEVSSERVVTVKNVSNAEEYLLDHFPTFPVLPGVMMLESMVQAARRLMDHADPSGDRWVLGRVRALKYGRFVKPGATMRITVTRAKDTDEKCREFRGEVHVIDPQSVALGAAPEPAIAASGRFSLRPVAVWSPVSARAETVLVAR